MLRSGPATSYDEVGKVPPGGIFLVTGGPQCDETGMVWWEIDYEGAVGWTAQGEGGTYWVRPLASLPAAEFVTWDWAAFMGGPSELGDPMTMEGRMPPSYAGDLPALPVDLAEVRFVEDAALNEAQLALLAQNGFVVVPAGLEQFVDAYWQSDWPIDPINGYSESPGPDDIGHAFFVTSDSMLHALHYIFDNLLTDLERSSFYDDAHMMLAALLQEAHAQAQDLAGTPLAEPAANLALYLAVGLELFEPGAIDGIVGADAAATAREITAMALAGEGKHPVPFLADYREDFSQYRPRGHYAGDEQLERYFRGMMWLSRITFRASEDSEIQMALLMTRAMLNGPGVFARWFRLHSALTFLIGPVDDLGPPEYGPLAGEVFGEAWLADPAPLADPALLNAFRAGVKNLPGPRINGLILPIDTTPENVEERTRGFRLLGQRFTFDGYVMQQMMFPYVGTLDNMRALPMSLDIAAAIGSETAYALADAAGATAYQSYDAQLDLMRGQVGTLTQADWLENIYGGWLWTLKPLWVRGEEPYPPLMRTEAWLRRDLQTGFASWTELKHDTVLYVKQPTGFGGGGGAPMLTSFGYVEPNPLVFARISAVAAMTYQGLVERGLLPTTFEHGGSLPAMGLYTSGQELRTLARQAARVADMARKELAGEPLTEDEYWWIVGFSGYLDTLLRTLYQGDGRPDPVALVTDVANDGMSLVLQEGVGNVDYIYVVAPTPHGTYQVVRGGVFSYYEFVGNMDERMTDETWRAWVQNDQLPPRPSWVDAFFSD